MTVFITISGAPGAGKSTLARFVAQRLGAAMVAFDDFEIMTRAAPQVLANWQRAGSPYGALVTPKMTHALTEALATGAVVFDTPLGRAAPLPRRPDLAVWIDCPPDLALARKLGQLASQVPAGQAAEFLGWMRGYLDAYPQMARYEIALQAERVPQTCDLTLSALEPVERMASRILSALRQIDDS